MRLGGGEHPLDGSDRLGEGSCSDPSLLRLDLVAYQLSVQGAEQARTDRHCLWEEGKGRQASKIPRASLRREPVPARDLPAADVSSQKQQGGC